MAVHYTVFLRVLNEEKLFQLILKQLKVKATLKQHCIAAQRLYWFKLCEETFWLENVQRICVY